TTPDLKEIRDAALAKFDMMELMEETLGSALQAVQLSGGLRRVEPVTQEEVTSLEDAVKELRLLFQRSVAKDRPPGEWKHFVPGLRPPRFSRHLCLLRGEGTLLLWKEKLSQ
ncbi:hypothetical protein VP01_11111g1, partial [Puccinia sorghi]